MSSKILICSHSPSSAKSIRQIIDSNLPFQTMVCYTHESVLLNTEDTQVKLLIFENHKFKSEDAQLIRDLRSKGFYHPCLLLLDQVPQDVDKVNQTRVHFLAKPYSDKDLLGICKKMLVIKKIPQQRYKRFKTNQKARIECIIRGESLDSNVYNISMGGAYCEFTQDHPLNLGELVRLKIMLNDVESEHTMNAKVVWTTKQGSFAGGPGVGLKFIKSDDIYKDMVGTV